jgi:hypothetical protein
LDATYDLFANNTVMNSWYGLDLGTYLPDTARGAGRCSASLFHGESSYNVSGRIAGRYFCYVARDDGNPNIVATDIRHGVGLELQFYAGHGPAALESFLRQWACCLRLT